MAGCLVYSSIASTRSGVGLGARGATRVKLGPPTQVLIRCAAARLRATPRRSGRGCRRCREWPEGPCSRFFPPTAPNGLRLSGGPRGLLRLLYALDRGAGAGSGSGVAALQRNFLFFALLGSRTAPPTHSVALLARVPGRLALSLKSA